MRVAEDDRARVPFALVGVLLVLGSAAYAATLATRPAPGGRVDANAALDRTDAALDATLHRATRRAADAAARDPVVEPANTTAGRVLDDEGTFRDYLRLRVYLSFRAALPTAETTVGGVRATASLPATRNASALRAAKQRVHLQRIDGGLRVTVENVTVRLVRDGRVVERRNRTVTRRVATPVLAVHERVREYVRRLNRQPSEGPGLGQRLTARLFAVAWARGYAQYGGAPVDNVLANRHLELMTNGALLSVQRSTFGRSDPAGRRAVTRASAYVGARDLLRPGLGQLDRLRDRLVRRPGPTAGPPPRLPAAPRQHEAAGGNHTVGVNLSADRAFAEFVEGGDVTPPGGTDVPTPRDDGATTLDWAPETTLEDVLGSVYGADVRLLGRVARADRQPVPPPDPPGANWTLVAENTTERPVARPGEAVPPAAPESYHRLQAYHRTVVVHKRIERTWRRNGSTTTTNATWTNRYAVGLALVGRHAPSEAVPRRGFGVVHERGGPLDGPNLRGVADRAVEEVVDGRGGPDELAVRVVEGSLAEGVVHVEASRPDGLEDWLVARLASLRDRIRNVSVTVPRAGLGVDGPIPAAELAAAVRDRREEFVGVPETYGSVARKALVAARAAYVAAVVAALEDRAADARVARIRLRGALAEAGLSNGTLTDALSADRDIRRPPPRPVATGGPVGERNATVRGAPPYLTLSSVSHDQVRAVHPGERHYPLVARNVNYATVPTSDVADKVVDAVFTAEERTRLATAARALRAANASLAREHDAELARRRDELRREVGATLGYVNQQLQATLTDETGLGPEVAAEVTFAAVRRWNTTAARGMAAANGSLAEAVATVAVSRADVQQPRALLVATLRVTLAEARREPGALPAEPVVNGTATAAEALAVEAVDRGVGRAVDAGAEATVEELEERLDADVEFPQAGVPLLPYPGYWYATANVWSATVRGEYARFAVSVPAGAPGERLTYERDGDRVALDWNGDGSPEPVGRATRVSFSIRTAVVVVVPPGPPGVGDRGGDADERSPGWPRPGNASGRGDRLPRERVAVPPPGNAPE